MIPKVDAGFRKKIMRKQKIERGDEITSLG